MSDALRLTTTVHLSLFDRLLVLLGGTIVVYTRTPTGHEVVDVTGPTTSSTSVTRPRWLRYLLPSSVRVDSVSTGPITPST